MQLRLGIQDIRAAFQPLPQTTEEPNYAFIKLLIRVLQANTLTVFSSRGNGTDGHQRILEPLVDYNNRIAPAGPWADPTLPTNLSPGWLATTRLK